MGEEEKNIRTLEWISAKINKIDKQENRET